MKKYNILIYNESGAIVLNRDIKADSVNNAMQQVIEYVDLYEGDTIQIKLSEE